MCVHLPGVLQACNLTTTATMIGINWKAAAAAASKACASSIFFYLSIVFFWLLSWREANKKIGVRVGERGVCI